MVGEATRREIGDKLTNFDLNSEVDRCNYERVNKARGAQSYIEDMQRLNAEPPEDLGYLTRAELEKKYHKVLQERGDALIALAEISTILNCLDMKVSIIIADMDEALRDGVVQPENFLDALAMNGFSADHKLSRRYRERQEGKKERRGTRLRVVK